jgi:hypothetical protein
LLSGTADVTTGAQSRHQLITMVPAITMTGRLQVDKDEVEGFWKGHEKATSKA